MALLRAPRLSGHHFKLRPEDVLLESRSKPSEERRVSASRELDDFCCKNG